MISGGLLGALDTSVATPVEALVLLSESASALEPFLRDSLNREKAREHLKVFEKTGKMNMLEETVKAGDYRGRNRSAGYVAGSGPGQRININDAKIKKRTGR